MLAWLLGLAGVRGRWAKAKELGHERRIDVRMAGKRDHATARRALDDGPKARGLRGLHGVTQLVHKRALAEIDHPLLDPRQLDVQDRDDEIIQDMGDHPCDGA